VAGRKLSCAGVPSARQVPSHLLLVLSMHAPRFWTWESAIDCFLLSSSWSHSGALRRRLAMRLAVASGSPPCLKMCASHKYGSCGHSSTRLGRALALQDARAEAALITESRSAVMAACCMARMEVQNVAIPATVRTAVSRPTMDVVDASRRDPPMHASIARALATARRAPRKAFACLVTAPADVRVAAVVQGRSVFIGKRPHRHTGPSSQHGAIPAGRPRWQHRSGAAGTGQQPERHPRQGARGECALNAAQLPPHPEKAGCVHHDMRMPRHALHLKLLRPGSTDLI